MPVAARRCVPRSELSAMSRFFRLLRTSFPFWGAGLPVRHSRGCREHAGRSTHYDRDRGVSSEFFPLLSRSYGKIVRFTRRSELAFLQPEDIGVAVVEGIAQRQRDAGDAGLAPRALWRARNAGQPQHGRVLLGILSLEYEKAAVGQ